MSDVWDPFLDNHFFYDKQYPQLDGYYECEMAEPMGTTG